MQWLLESPWPALGIGAVVIALLVVTWQNTRRRGLLTAMGAVLACVLLLLLIEWAVVTDQEAVEQTLEEMATALESNDPNQVLSHLAPDATQMRSAASHYLPSVTISDANVGNDLKVTVNRLTTPITARAEFTGRLTFEKQPRNEMPYNNFVRKFSIRLRKEGDRWLLLDYETSDLGGRPTAD
jgi:hypothetical protein